MPDLLATILAIYAWSHMLVFEYGPADMLTKFRYFMGVREDPRTRERYGVSTWGDLLNCQICTSVWVGIPIAWLCSKSKLFAYAFAAVGLICLMEDISGTHQ